MTFYQELQLDQAGSKAYIASFEAPKDRWKHSAVYLFKVLINIAFCTAFIALFSAAFGTGNSVAGLAVLLCVMVFRRADLGIHASHGVLVIFAVFGILAAGPHLSNLVPVGGAFCINASCILLLVLLGCHNVIMFNHSTLVLAYLLIQGYDVTGEVLQRRLAGLLTGACLTALVYYRNHRKQSYKRSLISLFREFDLSSARTRWQLRLTFGISVILLAVSCLGTSKAMWAGIAAMSVFVPFRNDLVYRVKLRSAGSVLGSILFLALYFLLPEGSLSYMGIIGGICVGFSASYGWQTAFNAMSAIAMAVPVFGLPAAVLLRIFHNVFASAYAWLFDRIFDPLLSAILAVTRRRVTA